MSAFRTNQRRKALEQSGQLGMFEVSRHGTITPANPPVKHPVVEPQPGDPEPPKAIELADESRRESLERVEARQAMTREVDMDGLSERERQFLEAVERHGYTPQTIGVTTGEVSELTGVPVQSFTQACINLREKGLIELGTKRRCGKTGQTATAWVTRPADPKRSVNPMVRIHGYAAEAGATCSGCFHFSDRTRSRKLRRCLQRTETTDSQHWGRWPACGKWTEAWTEGDVEGPSPPESIEKSNGGSE